MLLATPTTAGYSLLSCLCDTIMGGKCHAHNTHGTPYTTTTTYQQCCTHCLLLCSAHQLCTTATPALIPLLVLQGVALSSYPCGGHVYLLHTL